MKKLFTLVCGLAMALCANAAEQISTAFGSWGDAIRSRWIRATNFSRSLPQAVISPSSWVSSSLLVWYHQPIPPPDRPSLL